MPQGSTTERAYVSKALLCRQAESCRGQSCTLEIQNHQSSPQHLKHAVRQRAAELIVDQRLHRGDSSAGL